MTVSTHSCGCLVLLVRTQVVWWLHTFIYVPLLSFLCLIYLQSTLPCFSKYYKLCISIFCLTSLYVSFTGVCCLRFLQCSSILLLKRINVCTLLTFVFRLDMNTCGMRSFVLRKNKNADCFFFWFDLKRMKRKLVGESRFG